VGINILDGNVDLNPDFVFESRGRLVPGGYEVEIRIPFKSLRYGEGAEQSWGINVLRRVQHSGYQDSWAPAVRANASFLGQSGTIDGLHDLKRGLVLDVTPAFTQRLDGAPAAGGGWHYGSWSELGGDTRWGITQNMSLNATFKPDFSQVEADVGQVQLNERFALFFPEKRPFFLDGLELFDTPNQLIYTRRIVDPNAGVKLAGKVKGTNIASLFAVDNSALSSDSSHPLFGALRVRRDLGRSSTLGLVATTREDGDNFSRLLGGDARFYHSKLYFVEVQAVQSWTRAGGAGTRGPLFQATWDRTGRDWGFNYGVQAISPGFQAAAGFVNRTGVMDIHAYNRLTGYGKRGALVQTYGAFFIVHRIFDYMHPARERSRATRRSTPRRRCAAAGHSSRRSGATTTPTARPTTPATPSRFRSASRRVPARSSFRDARTISSAAPSGRRRRPGASSPRRAASPPARPPSSRKPREAARW